VARWLRCPFQDSPETGQTSKPSPIKSKLKCMYTNADTLSNKMHELEVILKCFKPDIFAVTEVMPKTCRLPITEAEISMEGYSLVSNLKGGRGVVVYIRNGISYSVTGPERTDTVWIDLQVAKPVRIGCIYRSQQNSEEENMEINDMISQIQESTPESSDLIIVGDFNFRELNWDTLQATVGENHKATRFLKTVLDAGLSQVVSEPTRRRRGQEPSLLDLILVRDPLSVSSLSHEPPLGASDHDVLFFNMDIGVPEATTQDKKNFFYIRGDYEGMREAVTRQNLAQEMETKGVQDSWALLKLSLHRLRDKFIPHSRPTGAGRGKRKPGKPLWCNPKALSRVKKKKEAWKRYLRTKEGRDYEQYITARNDARREVRRAVRTHEKELGKEAKKSPRKFWSYVKGKSKPREQIPDLKSNGSNVKEEGEKAEVFNKFFSSVFVNEDLSSLPGQNPVNPDIGKLEITRELVEKKLLELDTTKSQGPDDLHPKLLRELSGELAEPIAILFQKTLAEGELPKDWKSAVVTPIHKKGDRCNAANYRPVSLTCILCKVMEAIIRDHMMEHLIATEQISRAQFGFMPKRSCSSKLTHCIDSWSKAIDEGNCVDAIYIDFQKAFDSVPHERLLRKISDMGINGELRDWIRSFLDGRKQRVKVGGKMSEESTVTSGVPQGSVLGPCLFLMFVNDLPASTINRLVMFADDGTLFKVIRSVNDCRSLQDDLDTISSWCAKWQLSLNTSKCSLLRIGRGHPDFEYTLLVRDERINLRTVEEEKDLGVIITHDLKSRRQCEAASGKANRALFTLKRTINMRNKHVGTLLYRSMVRPILEYCSIVWGPTTKKDRDTLEKVQRRATRFICGGRDLSYTERLHVLNMPTLAYRRERGEMIEIFKLLNGKVEQMDNLFTLDRRTSHNTRGHPYKLVIPRCNTNLRAKFFTVRSLNRWNKLPVSVVCAPSLDSFKRNLDKHWETRDIVYNYKAED